MSLTRIQNENAFTGTIPADNFANATLDNVTSLPNAPLGDMVFISSATASSSASIEFTLGDYKEYKFFLVSLHPQTNIVELNMNFSTDSGSNYNVTKTTTYFAAFHNESDTVTGLAYATNPYDLAQSTSDAVLVDQIGNENDESCAGIVHLFNPSSSVYVKHFITRVQGYNGSDYATDIYQAGYANTSSALTNIRFKFSSGNIDDGKILMFGLN